MKNSLTESYVDQRRQMSDYVSARGLHKSIHCTMGLGLMLSVSLPSAACLTVVAASLGTLFPSYDKTVLSSAAGGINVVNILCLLSSTNLLGNNEKCCV